MTETHRFTTRDGASVAYYLDDFTDPWREAPPMVLLHSAMGNSERFYSWVPSLARHFQLIRMDLRGHGRSSVPKPTDGFSLEHLVGDVEELMARLGLESAHVSANSAGGYVAQTLAITAPAKVRSLAIVGSTPGLSPEALKWLPGVEKEGLTPFLRDTIAMRFDLASTDPGLVEWFLKQTGENDQAFVTRFIGHMASREWADRLHRIQCPTLVMFPGGETVGSVHGYDAFARSVKDVRMVEYPHMPHNVADMLPDRCVADILAFHREKFGYPK